MNLSTGTYALIPACSITHTAGGATIERVLANTRYAHWLERMIRRNGITAPLLVCERQEGGYALVAGRRRIAVAFKIARETETQVMVPALVVPRERWHVYAVLENRGRANNPASELEALLAAQADPEGLTEFSREVGAKRLRSVESFARLAPGPRALLVAGHLSVSAGRYLATLSEDTQEAAIEGADSLSHRALRQWVTARIRQLPLFARQSSP